MSYHLIKNISLVRECHNNNDAEVKEFFNLWPKLNSKQKSRVAKKAIQDIDSHYDSCILILSNRGFFEWIFLMPYIEDYTKYFNHNHLTSSILYYAMYDRNKENIYHILSFGGFNLKDNFFTEEKNKRILNKDSINYVMDFFYDLIKKNIDFQLILKKEIPDNYLKSIKTYVNQKELDRNNLDLKDFVFYNQMVLFKDFSKLIKNHSKEYVGAYCKMEEIDILLSLENLDHSSKRKVIKV